MYNLVLRNHIEALRMLILKSKSTSQAQTTHDILTYSLVCQTLKTLNPGSSIMQLCIFQFDFMCLVNSHILPHIKMTLKASTGSFSLFKGSTRATEGALP